MEAEPETFWSRFRRGFPVRLTDAIRIPGMIFDTHLTLDAHFTHLNAKARRRQALPKGLATTAGEKKWVFSRSSRTPQSGPC